MHNRLKQEVAERLVSAKTKIQALQSEASYLFDGLMALQGSVDPLVQTQLEAFGIIMPSLVVSITRQPKDSLRRTSALALVDIGHDRWFTVNEFLSKVSFHLGVPSLEKAQERRFRSCISKMASDGLLKSENKEPDSIHKIESGHRYRISGAQVSKLIKDYQLTCHTKVVAF